jgi:hypothetical protein
MPVSPKPAMCFFVIHVCGIEKRNQNIHIEERHTHSSSRN